MVKIYVEGGGDSSSLKSECREAFSKLIQNAGFEDSSIILRRFCKKVCYVL